MVPAAAFERGEGVPVDLERATALYNHACQAAYRPACERLRELVAAGTIGVEQVQSDAFALEAATAEDSDDRDTSSRSYRVLGHLETRDGRVTLLGGPEGGRYRVVASEERPLPSVLSEQELRDRWPEVYDQIASGAADREGGLEMLAY